MKKTILAMSTIEYSMLIAIVVAALLVMQFYLKRGVCGQWKSAGDVFGFGRQYDPSTTIIVP
jgi:Flp pilus assembly pilin Flp